MKVVLKSSLAIACAIACSSGNAQTQTFVQTKNLDEIVVTAKGQQTLDQLINTAHIFNEQDIIAAQVKSVPDLLARIAGITISDSGGRGSTTSVFIRGVSSSQTIVLIDGVRVGSATLGAAALNTYPIEAIQRIEVLKGPFSGIYGADAAGGVIQLFTKKGENAEKIISASAGSDGLGEASLSLGFGNDENSIHISAQREETDGIDRTSILSAGNDDKDAYEETAFSIGGKLTLGENTVAKLNLLATDNSVDFDNLFGNGEGNKIDNESLSTAFNITHVFSDRLTWSTTLGTNEDEAVTSSSFPSTFTTNRDTLGTEVQYSLTSSTLITAGVDYYEEDIESSTSFPVTNRDNKAIYAQLQTSSGAFDLVASLRGDDNSAYGSETNGSIALAYRINDNLRASASYGSAFIAPSFNFLYFPFFGNPDILPEESDSFEVSLDGSTGITDWRVSAYQTDITNLFSFDPSTFLAANVGEAQLQGIEAELHMELFDWNFGIFTSFLDAEDKLTGAQLDDRPEKTLNINARKDFGDLGISFDIRSETGRVDRGETPVAGYGLFDIAAVYQVTDQLTLMANIDNVFDKDYTVNLATANDRFNTEGRQMKFTVRYAF